MGQDRIHFFFYSGPGLGRDGIFSLGVGRDRSENLYLCHALVSICGTLGFSGISVCSSDVFSLLGGIVSDLNYLGLTSIYMLEFCSCVQY